MKNYIIRFWVLLIVFGLSKQLNAQERISHQYIVLLQPGVAVNEVTRPGLTAPRMLSKQMNIWLLESDGQLRDEEVLQQLYRNPAVKLAQYNHRFEERGLTPDDTRFSEQWNMLNTGQNNGVSGADIEATEAWNLSNGNLTANGDTIVVAVIDKKFDLLHEDLNYFYNYGEIEGNSIDDDGNGYIDDIIGWNVPANNGSVNSQGFDAQHSTHCAGIVGAKGNNALGVAGVCWGVKILPVNYGTTDEANVVAAYDYVREMRRLYNTSLGAQGAFVVSTNSSFGVDKEKPADYPIWCAMYDSMGAVGILSAGATANSGWNVDTEGDIPTSCESNFLISVTNTTRLDIRNANAAYGKRSIDIGAPGTSVLSTVPPPLNNYGLSTGTSMATPHVAGAVAAMYAAACKGFIDYVYERPDSAALLFKQYLLDAAEWNSSLNNTISTNGRLNLYRAIQNLKRYNCDSCNFDLAIDKVDITCYGAANGAMTVMLSGGGGNGFEYLWSNGINDIELVSTPPGFYTVMVKQNGTNCRRYATAELHNPDSIAITNIAVIPADSSNPGNITVTAKAGNDTLLYSIDGNTFQASPIFSITQNGTYTVYVKNTLGCVAEKTVVISSLANPSAISALHIYPNPAGNELTIALQNTTPGNVSVQLYTMLGRLLWEGTVWMNAGYGVYTVDVSTVANGLYALRVGNAVTRIEVLK